ncbi:MAG: FdhE protein [Pseudomonadota bacterium]|nr:FdhE protein [Pseudomonadota bacterium]
MSEVATPEAPRPPAEDAPFVRAPGGEYTFRDRARRLHTLAAGHSLGDYLKFMAHLVEAQAHAAQALAGRVPAAEADDVARRIAEGQPVYPALGWPRDPVWRQALDLILGQLSKEEAASLAVRELGVASTEHVEAFAERLLAGKLGAEHPGQAPLVAAAIQVYWNALAAQLDASQFRASGPSPVLCPVCGSAPVASVVRIGGAEQGLRYLHCSLCDTEWHMPRVQCSNCGNTQDLGFFAVEGGSDAVKAEACDACHSYLKQVYMTKAPQADPVADDLATLTLDMLMAEREYLRSGPNLLFVPGKERSAD